MLIASTSPTMLASLRAMMFAVRLVLLFNRFSPALLPGRLLSAQGVGEDIIRASTPFFSVRTAWRVVMVPHHIEVQVRIETLRYCSRSNQHLEEDVFVSEMRC